MKTIKLTNYQIEENWKCSEKQFKFITGLMKPKHEILFLNKLAFDGRDRLTISEASKLINCLLQKEEFELVEKDKH